MKQFIHTCLPYRIIHLLHDPRDVPVTAGNIQRLLCGTRMTSIVMKNHRCPTTTEYSYVPVVVVVCTDHAIPSHRNSGQWTVDSES